MTARHTPAHTGCDLHRPGRPRPDSRGVLDCSIAAMIWAIPSARLRSARTTLSGPLLPIPDRAGMARCPGSSASISVRTTNPTFGQRYWPGG